MTQKHTHKLRRHIYKTGARVYFCTLPDCYHKIECSLAVGKMSICNICGEEFQLNEYHVRLAKPHCDKCGKIKIKGSDGKKHYIRRDSLPVMASLAESSVDELRSRLNNLTQDSGDEDIL